jgi:CheY-like chemotaxis protein
LARPDFALGRHICLRVTDTGHGMSPEMRARLFEPFFTTKEPGKGTGLGLATVFGIVKQHQGAIAVESNLGQGATFNIYLRREETIVDDKKGLLAASKPRGGTETILLVEDEESLRKLTRIILVHAGYRVLEAANGIEALRLWEQHQESIQLLFTDMVMPGGMSGREVAADLQERNPKLRVIFTSGYSADIAGRELILQEGQKFIPKPALPSTLLEIVRQSLDA